MHRMGRSHAACRVQTVTLATYKFQTSLTHRQIDTYMQHHLQWISSSHFSEFGSHRNVRVILLGYVVPVALQPHPQTSSQ